MLHRNGVDGASLDFVAADCWSVVDFGGVWGDHAAGEDEGAADHDGWEGPEVSFACEFS